MSSSDSSERIGERRVMGPAKIVTGAIFIGCAPVTVRFGINMGEDGLGPFAIAFWRFVIAIPILFAILIVRDRSLPPRPNRFVIVAGVCFAADLALWHVAVGITTVANSTFLVNLGNMCLGFTAWLVLKERPSRLWFYALPFAILGAALLSQGGAGGLLGGAGEVPPTGALSPDWRGDLLALGAAIFAACYMLSSKIARLRFDGLLTVFYVCIAGSIFSALLVILASESFIPPSSQAMAVPVFLAIVVQVVGQWLLLSGLGQTHGAVVAMLFLIQPLTAALLSTWIFSEIPSPLQIVGGALILLTVWVIGQSDQDKNRATPD